MKRQKNEEFRRSFSVENNDEKNGRRKAKIFQNKCVSSQKHRMKKEEGATAPTFSQRADATVVRRP